EPRVYGQSDSDRRGVTRVGRTVPGDEAVAGGEQWRFVADEHAEREARILLRGVGVRWRRMGADSGSSDGVPQNLGGGAGGGAGERRQPVVPAGVSVRVRGDGGGGVFQGVD